jgi:restriction system protein
MILIIIITAVVVSIFISKKQESYPKNTVIDPLKISIKDIDCMQDGSDFEEYLYRLFLALGYNDVYKTQGSRDFGSDLVFTDREGYRNVIVM